MIDPSKIRSLLTEYEASTDAHRKSDLLDELQDAVGMSGKMVMDNDILKKARQILAG